MTLADPTLPAQVFGRRVDMWTTRATDLLERAGLRHVLIDLDDPRHAGLADALVRETRRYQTPYVFVRGRYVGGYAELDELHRLGQLDAAPQPPVGATAVVVAPRAQEFVPPALLSSTRRPPGEPDA
jgi:glutaredoxin